MGEIYTKPFLVNEIKNLDTKNSKIIYNCSKCNKKVDYSRTDMAIMRLGNCCKLKKNGQFHL